MRQFGRPNKTLLKNKTAKFSFGMTGFKKKCITSKQWLSILLLSAILCCFVAESKAKNVTKLGAIFSTANLTVSLRNRLLIINKNLTLSNISLQFEVVECTMNNNPIRAALDVCENVLNEDVYAVFVNQDNSTSDAVMGISYTCGFFEVPVVGIGIRDTIFSDKVNINVSNTFLQFTER